MMGVPVGNARCPCGSGKKFRHCCANRGAANAAGPHLKGKKALWMLPILAGALPWLLIALLAKPQIPNDPAPGESAPSDTSPARVVPTSVTASELEGIIDFSGVDDSQSQDVEKALKAFNMDACTCGCSYTMARCLLADKHCPLHGELIARIQDAVDRIPKVGNGKAHSSEKER